MKHRRKRPRTSSKSHNWDKAVDALNKSHYNLYRKVPSHYSLLYEKRPQRRANKRIVQKIKYDLSIADDSVFNDKKSVYYW